MNGEEPLLVVQDVSYEVQGKRLLAPVTFTLAKGEFVWLTGPSGAGKSTLLKIIASLLEPSSGEILFQGQTVGTLQPEYYRQQVSYVFQTPVLFGNTVYDNLALPWKIRQRSPDRQAMIRGLEQLNLAAETLDRSIDRLSGGEKQRVALLRNLQFSPHVLLLDEITSALDEENRKTVRLLIDEQVRQGAAVVWISHDSHEIDSSRRVLTLSASGEIA